MDGLVLGGVANKVFAADLQRVKFFPICHDHAPTPTSGAPPSTNFVRSGSRNQRDDSAEPMPSLEIEMGAWYALAWIADDLTPVYRVARIIRPPPEIRPGRSFELAIERPAAPGHSDSGIYRFRLIGARAIEKGGPMVLGALTLEWLERFAPGVVGGAPFPAKPWFPSDAQHFLDDVFGPLPSRRADPPPDNQPLLLRKRAHGDATHVVVEGPGWIVEAKSFLALCDKALALMRRHFSGHRVHGVVAAWLPDEREVLTACALRIDGYRYLEALAPEAAQSFMARGERLEIPADEVELHVSFFLWQRSLMHSPAMDWESPRWRHFRELFFLVVDRPPPPALIEPSRFHEWLVEFEPRRAQCIEAVRIAHLAASYTDAPPAGFFGTGKA